MKKYFPFLILLLIFSSCKILIPKKQKSSFSCNKLLMNINEIEEQYGEITDSDLKWNIKNIFDAIEIGEDSYNNFIEMKSYTNENYQNQKESCVFHKRFNFKLVKVTYVPNNKIYSSLNYYFHEKRLMAITLNDKKNSIYSTIFYNQNKAIYTCCPKYKPDEIIINNGLKLINEYLSENKLD